MTSFHKRGGNEKGYRSACKECLRTRNENYRKANLPKRAAAARKWRRENREGWRDASLRDRYNIGIAEWDLMFKEQKGCCLICEMEFEKTPHVDHDHETGVVRGLLCGPCNRMLGQARDSSFILKKGAEYLEN